MKLEDFITIKKPLNRRGLFSNWTAKIGDAESVQPTKQAAIEGLFSAVRNALSGDSTPVVLFSATHYALVWKHFDTWAYEIRPISDPKPHGWTVGFASKDEARSYAQKHLDDVTADAATDAR